MALSCSCPAGGKATTSAAVRKTPLLEPCDTTSRENITLPRQARDKRIGKSSEKWASFRRPDSQRFRRRWSRRAGQYGAGKRLFGPVSNTQNDQFTKTGSGQAQENLRADRDGASSLVNKQGVVGAPAWGGNIPGLGAGLNTVCESGSFEPFLYKNDHFTKTGSGQT